MLPKWLKKDTQDKKTTKNKQKLNVTWHLRILDNQLPETVWRGFVNLIKSLPQKHKRMAMHMLFILEWMIGF